MIDVLVPVLGRPQNAALVVQRFRQAATVPYRLVFLCTEEDEDQIAACRETEGEVILVCGEHSQFPRKINVGFNATENLYVFVAADDIEPLPGWDTTALTIALACGRGVIGTNDQSNKWNVNGHFSTHPLIRRSYVLEHGGSLDGPGIVFHEGYDHNYVDRELCHLAQARNEWAFAVESRLIHHHPAWAKAPSTDATYAKGRRTFHADHELFIVRAEQWGDVGLLPQELQWRKRTHRRRQRS
jgi:hypothetical protein